VKKAKEAMLYGRQRGFSLVEIMVALVIGLLAAYAIYVVYGDSERTKRNVVSVGEAQISGLYSVFLMNKALSNSGSGVLSVGIGAAGLLINCPTPLGLGIGDTLRPIPVAIDVDGAGNNQVFVTYGTSSLYPFSLSATLIAANVLNVTNAPLGFRPNSTLYVTDGGANCSAVQITGVTVNPANGSATVTVNGALPATVTDVVDMGTLERKVVRLVGDVLQVQRWGVDANGAFVSVTEPIVSNVMGFYAQYGLGPVGGGGRVTRWVDVRDDSTWALAAVAALPVANLMQIKAIRYGVIVRADEPERGYDQTETATLFGSCPSGTNCTSAPSITRTFTNPDVNGLGWRYRAYETMVPLRNSIVQ
jgi:type IV pilus assembly protein PilW